MKHKPGFVFFSKTKKSEQSVICASFFCSLSKAGEEAAAAGGDGDVHIIEPCTRAGAHGGEVTHDPLSTGSTCEQLLVPLCSSLRAMKWSNECVCVCAGDPASEGAWRAGASVWRDRLRRLSEAPQD